MIKYLLFFCIVLMLVGSYMLTNKDVISPWFISCGMYIASLLVVIINENNWGLDITGDTFITIFVALFSLGMGDLFARSLYGKIKKNNINQSKEIFNTALKPIIISKKYLIVMISIMLVTLVIQFKELYRLSIMAGNTEGYAKMFEYGRKMLSQYGNSTLLSLALATCSSISNFIAFIIIYNKINLKKQRVGILYIIILAIYIMQLILTTGRQNFIQFATAIIAMIFILIQRKYKNKDINKKLITIGISTIVLFLIVFFALGNLTNKSFLGFNRTISLYLGGSIIGLDQYLNSPKIQPTYFGENTLFGIYAALKMIKINVPSLYAPLEMIFIGHDGVNIYTPLRRYIQDFSYIGMIFIMFYIGFIYTSVLIYIRNKKYVGSLIVIFAMFFYVITEIAIEERFFMMVVSFHGLYKSLIVVLLFWFFIQRRNIQIT